MAPLFVTFAITAWISYAYRPMFNYPLAPAEWTLALGALFLLVGVPFWLLSTGMFLLAYFRGRLETRGPFAVMPNPIYGSGSSRLPGISLVPKWPVPRQSSRNPAAVHHAGDAALQDKFVQYAEYRKKVLIKFL
jgi:hypothetical protein